MHACIGEGNGNPLHYSWLENPSDRGAWWAAVCRVAQSRTRLKRFLSSSRWIALLSCPVESKKSSSLLLFYMVFIFSSNWLCFCLYTLIMSLSSSRKWKSTPVFLPGKSHGQRSLAVYNPYGCKRVGDHWSDLGMSLSSDSPAISLVLSSEYTCSVFEIWTGWEFSKSCKVWFFFV